MATAQLPALVVLSLILMLYNSVAPSD